MFKAMADPTRPDNRRPSASTRWSPQTSSSPAGTAANECTTEVPGFTYVTYIVAHEGIVGITVTHTDLPSVGDSADIAHGPFQFLYRGAGRLTSRRCRDPGDEPRHVDVGSRGPTGARRAGARIVGVGRDRGAHVAPLRVRPWAALLHRRTSIFIRRHATLLMSFRVEVSDISDVLSRSDRS